jgi:hypothetical protein
MGTNSGCDKAVLISKVPMQGGHHLSALPNEYHPCAKQHDAGQISFRFHCDKAHGWTHAT